MKTIVILVDLDLLKRFQKISDNRVKFLEHLVKNHDNIHLISPKDDIQQKYSKLNPDIVIHYIMGPGAGPVENQIITKNFVSNQMVLFWLEDMQHVDKIQPLIVKYGVKGLIMSVKQKTIVKKYLALCPKLIIGSLDHYIDDQIWREYGLPKIYDVVFYGYVDGQYPFRARLLKLFQSNQNRFRFKWIRHPGYWNLSNNNKNKIDLVTGENLARILNSSYLCVCTRSKHDMLVKKYLEASFCHCGIIGDIPTDYRKHFEGKMVEINENMSDSEILKILMNALENKEMIMNHTRHLADYLKVRFNYRSGGQYFVNLTSQMYELYQKSKSL